MLPKLYCVESEGERIETYYAPPDLWNRRQETGKNAAEIFAECGVPLTKSKNDRIQGWLNVKEWFKTPDILIFRGCGELIENIPKLEYSAQTNDVSTKPHDITHNTDALRYWCAARQLTPETEKEEVFDEFYEDEESYDEITEEYLIGGY